MRIVFMGTPEFAVPSLEILVKNKFEIAAVITAPDKPSGRGLKLSESPVKKFASENKLKVLQPLKLKDSEFLEELRSLQPDLQVVVAFRMLPEEVWSIPLLGTINLHASLLPDYRGAAPINWAIINGETETGLTTFYIEKQIDTGKIIFQEKVEIGFEETAGELHDRMMTTGAELVLKTVSAINQGKAPSILQPSSASQKNAPKLSRESSRINWEQPTLHIYNLIRGLSPYPAAWTLLDGKVFKIYRAGKFFKSPDKPSGSFIFSEKDLRITTHDGYIIPRQVQLEGKKKMEIDEFLRGYNQSQ